MASCPSPSPNISRVCRPLSARRLPLTALSPVSDNTPKCRAGTGVKTRGQASMMITCGYQHRMKQKH
ncbi:hypothetical protein RRG08_045485 [Elysia crispata]|uniref:Uncharacterized protein n=1 Tax=Elysia crispata TaxID=231223 RepID=A0AAE1AE01_9GAST|nr:hypothetical protein RRG08_045485 [Elysia crispata]